MKKEVDVKYPHSANLFLFCRKVLDHKFGGARVIDQDVGQILGFDPADCSHWKKGKKNIRSIQAMKSIASHLGVDEKLVVDIASGELTDHEGFYEYAGYGGYHIEEDVVESAKREFYAKHASTWTREKDVEFRHQFDLNEDLIDQIVADIHKKIQFEEAPLYLPEIAMAYSDIKLIAQEDAKEDQAVLGVKEGEGMRITFPATDKVRPHIRYQIAKTMSQYFFENHGLEKPNSLGSYADHVRDVQANLFAAKLLAPASLVRSELSRINIAKDIITQLADSFWVSKSFMNRRLKEILEKTPRI